MDPRPKYHFRWRSSVSQRELAGCDKVIKKHGITGQRFLNISDNDLGKFPKLCVPLISKISREINMNVAKKGIFQKRPAPPKLQEFVPSETVGWDEDEFDQSDDDYESPNSEDEDGGDYESPTEEVDAQDHGDSDYEPPPSEKHETVNPICAAKPISDSDYIDDTRSRQQPPVPPERPGAGPPPPFPRPNVRSKPDQSPQRPPIGRLPTKPLPVASAPAAPRIDRSKKPSTLERMPAGLPRPEPGKPPVPLAAGVNRGQSFTAGMARGSPTRLPVGHGDLPVCRGNTFPMQRNASPHPRPSLPGPPTESWRHPGSRSLPHENDGLSSRKEVLQRTQNADQDLDPSWYIGQVTRGQAEAKLWNINRDGAYLVRDSSKRSTHQPYTLMVLYQDKVYNIQIRYDVAQQVYLLGTGLKAQEKFQTVRNIIECYSQMPLLLIDAKNRGSGQQNQCPLIHPAGH
ncbi:lymphocyte cytosolic protein 2a isoform X2 [Engraulis encrasicolus]|uniref:lymphocyte cytosolic protein 2a isoform X2 n=1 Tax=Engraulis encrasicolus TaxID=184585 RepID=UPI002FCFDBED